jgi:hypothetical protein
VFGTAVCVSILVDFAIRLFFAREFFNDFVQGTAVSGARRKYGVTYPVMYPELKDLKHKTNEDRLAFLRVVRGHENFLEMNAQWLFAIFVNWFALKNYATVLVMSALVIVGRCKARACV